MLSNLRNDEKLDQGHLHPPSQIHKFLRWAHTPEEPKRRFPQRFPQGPATRRDNGSCENELWHRACVARNLTSKLPRTHFTTGHVTLIVNPRPRYPLINFLRTPRAVFLNSFGIIYAIPPCACLPKAIERWVPKLSCFKNFRLWNQKWGNPRTNAMSKYAMAIAKD